MRGLLLLAVVAAAVSVLAAPGISAPGQAYPTISIGPIGAHFIPGKFATQYYVSRYHLNGKPETVKVTWTLHLQLVDPAGAPDPAEPGAKAAVDLGCTNNLVGLPGHEHVDEVPRGHSTPSFLWHHPDAAQSVPPGVYHCDHNDMGPRGHQGLVKVVVSDKEWECTATYKGTNDSTEKSYKDGTATEPKCRKLD